MPSHIMDQRHSLFIPSALSSIFSEEIRFPSERQVGLRKIEHMLEHSGLDAMSFVPGSNSVLSSPLEKLHPVGGNYMNYLEVPQNFHLKGQKAKISYGNHFLGPQNSSDQKILPQSNLCLHPVAKGFHYENSIFSSSLSEGFSKKLRLLSNDNCFIRSKFVEDESLQRSKEIEAQTIRDLLPNDDDLLSGVIDDIVGVAKPNSGDEDYLFCSSWGGMEIESDEIFNRKRASDFHLVAAFNCLMDSLRNTSRALIVRNINCNVGDTDLRILFEQFGDIHAFYTANKHLGLLMVSFYDIRGAMNAKIALQDRLLMQQKLDIEFYVPKDNAPNKDINLAILTVVNLDSVVSKDQLHQIFGFYGDVKEIFQDPFYQDTKTIEFYDVRAAEAALFALDMSIIAGKRIMIELGVPVSGWRSCSGKHPSLDQVKQQKPIIGTKSSPPNNIVPFSSLTISGNGSYSVNENKYACRNSSSSSFSKVPSHMMNTFGRSSLQQRPRQNDKKKQFDLDIDRIIDGEDSRTTLMIKNIPNKYTSKMLLATIDDYHKGSYDFIYLPIDFKNKCNVGYAFINLTDPKHIIPLYQAFNGKKWEKFNSEKVASLAYARIQGKAALIVHFQNSSLMNEDKRCRPILFHSDGPNAGDQEPFPTGAHIRSRPGRSETPKNEEHCPGSLSELDSDSGNIPSPSEPSGFSRCKAKT